MAVPGPRCEAARPDGQLQLSVVDSETQQPIEVRFELRNSRGRPALPRGATLALLGGHGYLTGEVLLELVRGKYQFDLDAGPEWRTARGDFEIVRHADDQKTVEMERAVNLASEGWYGADLLAQRQGGGIDTALRAEGLSYAPLICWRHRDGVLRRVEDVEDNRFPSFGPQAALLESAGGDLLVLRTQGELTREDLDGVDPLKLDSLVAARKRGLLVLARSPTAWWCPVWLSAGVLDGILLIDPSSHATRGARPPDPRRYPGRRGAERWREAAYFQILNAGFRLPPLAGSGSGLTDAPLGSGRVYARLEGDFHLDRWWDSALADGVMVTNGPLLRPTPWPTGGGPPLGVSLATRTPIDYLELIVNGQVVQSVPLAEVASRGGKLPVLQIPDAGWFALRATATTGDAYTRALAGPVWVGLADVSRVDGGSCGFFLDWLQAIPPQLRRAGAEEIEQAEEFWQKRSERAEPSAAPEDGRSS